MFLANENFPRPSIQFLRNKGIFVKSIQEDSPAISDAEVIRLATEHKLIILTFDRDYGELIFRYAKPNSPAVVFFREKGNTPDFAGLRLYWLLVEMNAELNGAFTVIEEKNIRQRFYHK